MGGFNNIELARQAGKKSTRAGVSDKCTMQTRENFQMLVKNNLPRLQDDLNQLEPKDRVRAIIELAKFVIPRLNAVDITTGGEQIERYVTVNLESNE